MPAFKPENDSPSTTASDYAGYNDIVDYILGITFEIWEQRKVDNILDYYGADIDVFSLEGITHGSAKMVEQTHATLMAFPDRLLLAEDVIWSGDMAVGFSSHRINSPMTNRGATVFGAATGQHITTTNIADCEITQGRISREWLFRDNLALTRQLGLDTLPAAQKLLKGVDDKLRNWLHQEFSRVSKGLSYPDLTIGQSETDPHFDFAKRVLENCWIHGKREQLTKAYAPYCVLQRAPTRIFSGRDKLLQHYENWRTTLPGAKLTIDHICSQALDQQGQRVAVRWSAAAHHQSAFSGLEPTGNPIYINGVTHWNILQGQIVAEWTVFDELAMLTQALDDQD
jgi:predicted ester cyclase